MLLGGGGLPAAGVIESGVHWYYRHDRSHASALMLEDINIFTGLSVLLFFASFMAAMELAQWVESRKQRRK